MELTITIDTDNAAFEEAGVEFEAARILRAFARTIENNGMPIGSTWKLRDINGNTVGAAETTEDEEE
jgi:hypothetical protein